MLWAQRRFLSSTRLASRCGGVGKLRTLRRSASSRTNSGDKSKIVKPVLSRELTSLNVENSGSTARDHLANERTFLAWARTGLTFVGLGVAIDQVIKQGQGTPSSEREEEQQMVQRLAPFPLICTGALFLSYATHRYYKVQVCVCVRERERERERERKKAGPTCTRVVFLQPCHLALLRFTHFVISSLQRCLISGMFPINTRGVFMVCATSAGLVISGLVLVLSPSSVLGNVRPSELRNTSEGGGRDEVEETRNNVS